jgi:hypothetical protein
MNAIIDEIESLIEIVRGLQPNKPVEEPKKRMKRVKPVKCIPVHNHSIDDQVHQDCELCRTHGNILALGKN